MVCIAVDFRFALGRVAITPAAASALPPEEVALALRRHRRGDWGDLSAHDRRQNDHALAQGGRLLSVYRSRAGVRFYVLTEADRSLTTLLLPEDY